MQLLTGPGVLFQSLASAAAEEAAFRAIAGILGDAVTAVGADWLKGLAAIAAKPVERDARPAAGRALRAGCPHVAQLRTA